MDTRSGPAQYIIDRVQFDAAISDYPSVRAVNGAYPKHVEHKIVKYNIEFDFYTAKCLR